MWGWRACVVVLALGGGACGAATGSGARDPLQPPTEFPDRAKLMAVAEEPVEKSEGQKVVHVNQWSLDGSQLPSAQPEPTPEQVPWIDLLSNALEPTGNRVQPSQALHCTAAQAGLFVMRHGALPDQRLLEYMAARCGSIAAAPHAQLSITEVPASVPNAEVLRQWSATLHRDFSSGAEQMGERARMGIWVGRDDSRVVLVTVTARVTMDLSPLELDETGRVRVTGVARVGEDVAQVYGLINRGEHGVAMCRTDYRQKLPRFTVSCPMAEDDEQAWIELVAQPRRRLLGLRFGRVLMTRAGTSPEYDVGDRKPTPVTSPEAFRKVVISGVNRARQAAGLRPVRLAAAQSQVNQKLAAHFFNAELVGDKGKADLIGLGLLAGWDVQGTIRDGNLFTEMLPGSHDAGAWLARCMDSPFARSALLAPDVREIALGATLDRPLPGLGVVTTAYSFFETTDHTADEQKLVARLRQRRVARREAAPLLVDNAQLAEQAKLVQEQGKHPQEALEEAMKAMTSAWRVGVRGGVVVTNTLEHLEFPAELLSSSPLHLAVAITHVKLPGTTWGAYVILFVVVDRGVSTAAAPHRMARG